MEYDIDYEIYKYINEQVKEYVPLDYLLKQNNTTSDEVLHEVMRFRQEFDNLLLKYHIKNNNIVGICFDLAERINENSDNSELHYIYFCVVTDFGLLNRTDTVERTVEQEIRNYIRQRKLIHELMEFLDVQKQNREKFYDMMEYMKKYIHSVSIDCPKESEILYGLTVQHTFLYGSAKNNIYRDNLNALINHINGDRKLKAVKPYIIFAVLTRKHGMMQNRADFIPNLKTTFQYQMYNIFNDNGKNFNNYQSYIELYDHLRRSYIDDEYIDISLCDFCFANLSPLSEWYYMYCKPDLKIPMTLQRKINILKPLGFPSLFPNCDYIDYDIDEFEDEHSEICTRWQNSITEEMTEKFLSALYEGKDISECTAELEKNSKYSVYAEIFMYSQAECLLETKFYNIAAKITEI